MRRENMEQLKATFSAFCQRISPLYESQGAALSWGTLAPSNHRPTAAKGRNPCSPWYRQEAVISQLTLEAVHFGFIQDSSTWTDRGQLIYLWCPFFEVNTGVAGVFFTAFLAGLIPLLAI